MLNSIQFMEQQSETNKHPITTLDGCIDLLHAAMQQAAGLVELDGVYVSESLVCREAIKWIEHLRDQQNYGENT